MSVSSIDAEKVRIVLLTFIPVYRKKNVYYSYITDSYINMDLPYVVYEKQLFIFIFIVTCI